MSRKTVGEVVKVITPEILGLIDDDPVCGIKLEEIDQKMVEIWKLVGEELRNRLAVARAKKLLMQLRGFPEDIRKEAERQLAEEAMSPEGQCKSDEASGSFICARTNL